ncbi:MAG: flavin reductase family protein [Phycisphaerae bacterium]|nr:flavin reductase family protein [Phycisphaerae bacterium]
MQIDPADLPTNLRYNLVIGTVVPRPIAVVGTRSLDGRSNLAPFSCFTYGGTDPLTLVVCVANPGRHAPNPEKDTLRNAKPVEEGGTGEFTVSVATEECVQRIVACAEPLEFGTSEFEYAGLSEASSTLVRAPRMAESPVCFECRTRHVVRLNPGAPGGGNLLIGTVVNIHLRDDLAHERFHIDAALLGAVGRMGGPQYCTTRERATIPMGAAALETDVTWQRDARTDGK